MNAMAMLVGEVAVAAHPEAEVQVAVTGGHIEIAATRGARAEKADEFRVRRLWWKSSLGT
jgi:hypothetical protein